MLKPAVLKATVAELIESLFKPEPEHEETESLSNDSVTVLGDFHMPRTYKQIKDFISLAALFGEPMKASKYIDKHTVHIEINARALILRVVETPKKRAFYDGKEEHLRQQVAKYIKEDHSYSYKNIRSNDQDTFKSLLNSLLFFIKTDRIEDVKVWNPGHMNVDIGYRTADFNLMGTRTGRFLTSGNTSGFLKGVPLSSGNE